MLQFCPNPMGEVGGGGGGGGTGGGGDWFWGLCQPM